MLEISRLLKLALAITALTFPTCSHAATVEGRVYSDSDGIYLEGASLTLRGTKVTEFAERGGWFRFRNLEPGEYQLLVNYTGLKIETINFEVSDPEQTLIINPVLNAAEDLVFEMESLEVTGTLLGQAKALTKQRAKDNLIHIVSSDSSGQFVDRNAAEALQRLPGIAVADSQGEGKFIIIRGADPRLNSISIDGVFAATPQENGRSTGLNLISIEQLESIEVTKSWLPDTWANFIGGSVNLVTRSALDRDARFATIESAIGKYEIADKESYRFSGVYGDVIKLGESQLIGIQISADYSEDNRGSESMRIGNYLTDVPWEIRNMPNGLNFSGYTLGNYEIKRERKGVSAKVEYRLNQDHEWMASYSYNRFDDDETAQETDYSISFNNYGGDRFLTTGIAEELGYDLEDPEVQERINTFGTTKRLTSDEAIALGDVTFDEDSKTYVYQKFGANSDKSWESQLTEDEINTWQLGGQHVFADQYFLDYMYYYSEADQNRAIESMTLAAPRRNSESGLSNGKPFIIISDDAFSDPEIYVTESQNPRIRLNEVLSEDTRDGFEVNLAFEYEIGDVQFISKTGWAMDFREKLYDRSYEGYSEISADSPVAELNLGDPSLYGGTLDNFLEDFGDYSFGPMFDTSLMRSFLDNPEAILIYEQNNDDETSSIINDIVRNYYAEEDTEALYFMQTFKYNRWSLIAGLRNESTKNFFRNYNLITRPEEPIGALTFVQPIHWRLVEERLGRDAIITEETLDKEYDHTLPAVHLVRRIGDNMVFRSAYTQTIKRPTFTDLIPREIPSVSGASFGTSVRLPNFELEPLESENYDLSFDYYFADKGAVGISLFYKDLDGPVYEELRIIEPGQDGWEELSEQFDSAFRRDPETEKITTSSNITWNTTRMVNAGKGELKGLEFYFDKQLTFLPDPFKGLGFSMNFSLIDSEVELLRPERREITTSSGELIELDPTVTLFQQPDKLANASLYYKSNRFLVRLSYNYRGESLQNVLVSESILEDLVDDIGLAPDALDTFQSAQERWDLFVEYKWKRFSIFLEITNLTNEPLENHYGDSSRLAFVRYTQRVSFIGLQWTL